MLCCGSLSCFWNQVPWPSTLLKATYAEWRVKHSPITKQHGILGVLWCSSPMKHITLHWDFSKQGPKSLLGHRLTKQTDIASFRRQLRFSTNHLLFKQNWKVAHIETVSNSDYFSSFNFLTTKNNTLAFKTCKILPETFQIPWIKMKLSIVTSGKLQCRSEFPQNFTIYLCR